MPLVGLARSSRVVLRPSSLRSRDDRLSESCSLGVVAVSTRSPEKELPMDQIASNHARSFVGRAVHGHAALRVVAASLLAAVVAPPVHDAHPDANGRIADQIEDDDGGSNP